MRTITQEVKIYSYLELSEKAKDKARNDYINNLDSNIFTEQVIEDLREKGLENLRPLYSLSCCQGDGLCLYGTIDFNEITGGLKNVFYKNFELSDYKVLKELKAYSKISFNHIGRYYHKHSVDIDIYIDGNLSPKNYENQSKIADKLLKNVKEWYLDLCDKYEKQGYDFFYGISNDELLEYCDAMGYEFLENGTLFSEIWWLELINQRYIENSRELGENLKTARVNSGLSQDVVSKLAYLNRSSLSYYENGRNTPTIFTIIKLMDIYKININNVIFTKNNEK